MTSERRNIIVVNAASVMSPQLLVLLSTPLLENAQSNTCFNTAFTSILAWIFGDPHIITPDEREYTFNGWGEYTLITLNSGDSDFVLQGRTSPTERETDDSPAKATVFRAFGAEENGTRVFVQLDPNTNNSLIIYGDGTDYTRRFQEEGDDFLVDEDHFTLMRDNGSLAVIFPSEIVFSVSIGWKSLVLGVFVPEKFRNQTRGLLGNYNTIKTDDFVLPDGTVLNDTLTDRQIHYQFGNAWSVTEANSVLRYGPKEGYSDYAHSEFTPIFFEEISASDKQAAENVCGAADRACIYDFVVSGSEGFALKTKECRKEALEENAASQNRLPTLEVPDNVTVTVNVPKTFRVSAYDPGDTVTYKLTNDGNGSIQIIETTGNITVTVNSNTPVTLKVFAVDSSEAQSVVYTIPLIVCFGCSSHGQCDFTRVQPAVGNLNFQHAACDCSTGWAGANCSKDYDACSSSPCHPMQTCTDQTPAQQASSSVGYTCSVCPAGYKSPAGQANLCLDVDECADDALNACEVTCNNTAGSYQCSCPDGYRLTSNLRSCVDVNECVEKSHNCKHICNNTDSGYSCLCEEGFDLESSGECVQSTATQNICSNSGCSQGCKAVEGPTTSSMVASCFCRSGYDLDPTNKKTCTDHDECKDNLCSHKCSNSQGGFTCSCYNGFQLNSDQRTCSPCPSLQYGPECAHTCLCNGRGLDCHSVTGCVCKEGWTGSQCQDDVNECEENPDVCGEVQVCTNTNGSYTCACQDGYSIDDDGVCQDVNECSNNTACGAHQVCRNMPGTFQCPCFSGYMNDKGTCKDMDECSLGSDNCQQKCVNVVGSYNCECYYGYRLNTDRATCSQVSEPCAEVENLSCDHGCTQDDTDIAVCFCRSGYTLNSDKQTCQDVNECQDVSKKCSHTCINTAGGFTCSCPSGMVLANDGKTCVSCPAGTYGADCSMNCSCGVGTSRCDAVTGCLCKTGWTGDKCQHDVNECDLNSTRQLCEVSGAECVNLKGGYKCRCPTGYTEDNSGVCQDIDECETSPCRQVCENSAGSYRCLCDAGFTLNSTNGECTRATTCWQKTCDASNGGCYVNDNGLETCSCNTGYTLGPDGVTCSLNEQCNCSVVISNRCESETDHDCSGIPNTRCEKSEGNYSCVCRKGYKEDSTRACVALTRLGFTVKVNVNIPVTNLTQEPSRSKIKKEGQKRLKTMLKDYRTNLLAISIHNMRAGSVIADVDVDVPSKSAQISASYLAVALVNITGQSTTLAGQTGTVGITVDGMEILFNMTYCDVFSRNVTCEEN
ncbi:fibrillin-1-like [Littorina saxatilis]|uniref:fibrillin-1-like n=1 Tax=Littorina saxatilis TaxID=31220 RepID=UPI0038B52196